MSETDHKINQSGIAHSEKCANPECGHVFAAHGSNGFICCVEKCPCKEFVWP